MDFSIARRNMIDNQIRAVRVVDLVVIDAIARVPREEYVSASYRMAAYVDRALEIAPGRFILEPRVFASLVQAARVEIEGRVLIVGSDFGYSAAVFSYFASHITLLEEDDYIFEQTLKRLEKAEINNVSVVQGKFSEGLSEGQLFDVILINGAVRQVPDIYCHRLDNLGRLVTILRNDAAGKGIVVTKHDGHLTREEAFDGVAAFLPMFPEVSKFSF